ncbi:MAG: AmmeMemoRadiSam system protein B [Deltaproteobacteria bacterium]|nr:AmmeMemoRadiSam system protein B [Deltaproteobacteria bacterium]
MGVRKASFAGSWYPDDPVECEAQIRKFLESDRFVSRTDREAVAGIVPHAGWFFSGDLACSVIAALRGEKKSEQPDVVVVFGMHLPAESRPYIMPKGAWQTPFGDLEVAEELCRPLLEEFPFTIESSDRFTPDNTIELQLPLISYFFDKPRIVAMGVPPSQTALKIGQRVVDMASGLGLSVKIIGSTDLTHYGRNYGFVPAGQGREAFEWVRAENDRRVIEKMMAMDAKGVVAEGLTNHNACCPGAAAAAIIAAGRAGARQAVLSGYSSSYEKSPGDSFVGYAGLVLTR